MNFSIREIPLLRWLPFFTLGTILGQYFLGFEQFFIYLLSLALLLIAYLFTSEFLNVKYGHLYRTIPMAFLFVLSGMLLCWTQNKNIDRQKSNAKCFIGKTSKIIRQTNSLSIVECDIIGYYQGRKLISLHSPVKSILFVKTADGLDIENHVLAFCATLHFIHNSTQIPMKNPIEEYWKKNGIQFTAYLTEDKYQVLYKDEHVFDRFIRITRQYFVSIIESISHDKYVTGLLQAMVLGYKNQLDPDAKKLFTKTGVIHVLAVSGLHVGIIYLFLSWILKLKRNQVNAAWKIILLIFILFLYAMITGFSPSVSRAVLMFSFMRIGELFGKKVHTLNALAFSAFIILIYNPTELFQLGFQLSYFAVLSIVIFYPAIYGLLFFKNTILDKLWSLTAVSLAAQIGTFPWALYVFHQFPVYFILSNWVTIPLSTLLVLLTFVYLFFSKIFLIKNVVSSTLTHIVYLLKYVLGQIEKLPYSVLEGFYLSGFEFVILITTIFFLGYFVLFKKTMYLNIVLALILVILTSVNIRIFENNRYQMSSIYHFQKNLFLHFVKNRSQIIITDIKPDKIHKIHFYLNEFNLQHGIKNTLLFSLDSIESNSIWENDTSGKFPDIIFYRQFLKYDTLTVFFFKRSMPIYLNELPKEDGKSRLKTDFLVVLSYRSDLINWIKYLQPRKIVVTARVNLFDSSKFFNKFEKRLYLLNDSILNINMSNTSK